MKKEDWYHTPYHEEIDTDVGEKELSKSTDSHKYEKSAMPHHQSSHHSSHAHVSSKKKDDSSLDNYLKKHTSLSHSQSMDENEDAIKEAAKEEILEGAKKAEENA